MTVAWGSLEVLAASTDARSQHARVFPATAFGRASNGNPTGGRCSLRSHSHVHTGACLPCLLARSLAHPPWLGSENSFTFLAWVRVVPNREPILRKDENSSVTFSPRYEASKQRTLGRMRTKSCEPSGEQVGMHTEPFSSSVSAGVSTKENSSS